MKEEYLAELRALAEKLFKRIEGTERRIIAAMWSKGTSKCFTNVSPELLYDSMLDIGKRLSMMPVNMPEMVEGSHLVKTEDELDDISLQLGMDIPLECKCIIVVFGNRDEKDNSDSVFCMGDPLILSYLSLRCVTQAESTSESEDCEL